MNIIEATRRQASVTGKYLRESVQDILDALYMVAILVCKALIAAVVAVLFIVAMLLSPVIGATKAFRQRKEDRKRIISAIRKARSGQLPYQHFEQVAQDRLKLFPREKMYRQLLSISQRMKRIKRQRLLKGMTA